MKRMSSGRRGEAEHLGPDVAHADRAQGEPHQPDCRCARSSRAHPAGPRRARASLTKSLPDRAKMKVRMDTATGRRTPSGVMTTATSWSLHAARSTLSYPTPEARHDGEASVGSQAAGAHLRG